MTARPVRTEAHRVVRAAQFRLVFGVSRQTSQLVDAVRELTLVPVLADAVLVEGPAQFRFVTGRVHCGGGEGGLRCVRRWRWCGLRSLEAAVVLLRQIADQHGQIGGGQIGAGRRWSRRHPRQRESHRRPDGQVGVLGRIGASYAVL